MCQLVEVIYSCGHGTRRFCDRGFAPDGPCKHAPNFGATPVRIPHSCPEGLHIEETIYEEHLCPMNDSLMSCIERYQLSSAQNGVYLICRDRLDELWMYCGASIGPRLQSILKSHIHQGVEHEQKLHVAARKAMLPVIRAVARHSELQETLRALGGEWAMMLATIDQSQQQLGEGKEITEDSNDIVLVKGHQMCSKSGGGTGFDGTEDMK